MTTKMKMHTRNKKLMNNTSKEFVFFLFIFYQSSNTHRSNGHKSTNRQQSVSKKYFVFGSLRENEKPIWEKDALNSIVLLLLLFFSFPFAFVLFARLVLLVSTQLRTRGRSGAERACFFFLVSECKS